MSENPFTRIENRFNEIAEKLEELASRITPDGLEDPNELITKKEAAKLLGVTTVTVDTYARKGLLEKKRIGSRVRFRRGDVRKLIK